MKSKSSCRPRAQAANGLNFSAALFNARKETLLQQAQKNLRGRPPLTFEDLSWPTEQALAGDAGDLYRGSAQLFVGELLRLPDGRACLRAMLTQLPQHYNWQFAFLGAFHSHFERPLDVEKWWALSVTQAGGRDAAQAWTPEESWQKLDQAIHAAVQVRTRTNELPLHAEVTLQTMIREWDPVRQTQALNNTLRELGLLRLRIAQEYVGLAAGLLPGDRNVPAATRSQRLQLPLYEASRRRRAAEAAIQQLDALDARREGLAARAKASRSQVSPLPCPRRRRRPASPGKPSPPRTSPGTAHLRSARHASPWRGSADRRRRVPAS